VPGGPENSLGARAEAEIKIALANNLCRCGTHVRIVRAVQRAAKAV